jgi:hypothetical protein
MRNKAIIPDLKLDVLATYLPVWKLLGWSGLPFNRGERGEGGERAGGGGERAGRGAGLPHHSSILNIFYTHIKISC